MSANSYQVINHSSVGQRDSWGTISCAAVRTKVNNSNCVQVVYKRQMLRLLSSIQCVKCGQLLLSKEASDIRLVGVHTTWRRSKQSGLVAEQRQLPCASTRSQQDWFVTQFPDHLLLRSVRHSAKLGKHTNAALHTYAAKHDKV